MAWDLEFVVPRSPEQHDAISDDEDEAVENDDKTIFLFSQPVATSVQHIAWAAGPLHVHTIPADLSAAEDASGTTQSLMTAFCLLGHESYLTSTVSFMHSAMSLYVTEFGSYPLGSYKLVFVEKLPTQRYDAATLSLVTVDMLHGEHAINQIYQARHALSHALACQWIEATIQEKMWFDTWLVKGLGLDIAGL
ncbi:Transcription initiation factor TFIID subunit 2 [Trametes pubescens]|uniref:Transcription initiation factor TFIID subunit 2 n=1 Tax=Trametes pubescens TaxID=154538 RepID=A0A1M2V3I1_TRAPU|nr:Transcription initiation factor TFIID subunit 2 [Trametes pubescens]OJT08920.1 Transcription initiation factor TFIID subunit 2 [Trametes pubescens]OJT08928.1 Transcription initiation factor TFIID subunit 2 [Trametes pubescens]OJT09852.1 Transcription initiation factor TFIID subunit 2 [Trametes pubescens]